MKRFNLFDDAALAVDPDEAAGYGAPFASLRDRIGAEKLAASLVVLGRARRSAPTTTRRSRRSGCSSSRLADGPPPAGEDVVAPATSWASRAARPAPTRSPKPRPSPPAC